MTTKRNAFVFYRSFWEGVLDLPKSRRQAFLAAIIEYGLDGKEPNLAGAEMGMFRQIEATLSSNNERYENGKRGGRPKKGENKPVVMKKETSGLEIQNHQQKIQNQPIFDVDVDVDEDVDVDILFGKPHDISSAGNLIIYLNEKAGRSFQQTGSNLELVEHLLASYDERTIRAVIDNKVRMWKGDKLMERYLRPKTLFDENNFADYLEEPIQEGE